MGALRAADERERAMAAIAPWYALDFGDFDDDLRFYRELLRGDGEPRVLELGAGPGRVAIGLADCAEVTAVEDSPAMLAQGRDAMIAAGAEVLETDMRCLDRAELAGRFSLAVFALSTFQHLLARRDQIAALRAAAACLAPGGRVVLDLTAPTPGDFDPAPQPLSLEWVRAAPDGRTVTKLASQEAGWRSCSGVDGASPVAEVTYIYDAAAPGGAAERSLARFPLRVGITAGEVAGLFAEAGLRAVGWFGDYELSPAGAGERLIVLGERC